MLRERGEGRSGRHWSGLLFVITDLDRLLADVNGPRMAGRVAELIVATVWPAAGYPARVLSLIGD